MIRPALLLALIYAIICALMFFQQRGLIYYPQFTGVDPAHTDFGLVRDDGVTLRGWLLNPDQPRALVYFGGNAEAIEWLRDDFATRFPDHSIYLLAYRGYGASEGKPSERLLFADALALFDHVRERQPSASVSVVGRSLGSGVAAYLASQRPVDRLVLVTPFDSLVAVAQYHYPWLPVRWLLRERYETARHLANFTRPVLIIRATDDQIIPVGNTDALIAALPAPPAVLDVTGADHNFGLNSPAIAQALTDFLTQPHTPPP